MKLLSALPSCFVILLCLFVVADAKRKKKASATPPAGAGDGSNAYESMRPAVKMAPPSHAELAKSPAARKARAKELHAEGLEQAIAGNYADALPHMRAAVRMDPNDTGYQNDLGVTEMRMGQYQKAKWRFLKALEVDPTFDTAGDNIDEVKKYLTEEEYERGQGKYPQKHALQEPPEMDPHEFMRLTVRDDAEAEDLMGAAPICIRGAAQAWGWDHEKITLEHLAHKYGDLNADYYPHNMKEETVHPIFSPLKDAIEQLSLPLLGYKNLDTSMPGTYIQWNINEDAWRGLIDDMGSTLPELFEDKMWTDQCFSEGGVSTFNTNLHWKMMLIGEKDAGMFNHKDVMRMASWQVQLRGRKLWHICHPDVDLYKAGDVNTFQPDYLNFPRVLNASCYQTITNAGDAMYYPRDWWHQTRNLETPSIAFSGSMVNKDCHREFSLKLLEQCNGKGNVFRASKEHCAEMEKCIRNWDRTYEGGEGLLPTETAFEADTNDYQWGAKGDVGAEAQRALDMEAAGGEGEDEDITFHDEM